MSTGHYETNCSQYVLHRDGRPVMRPLDEIALAVGDDGDGGLLLYRHGAPEVVTRWYEDQKAKSAGQTGTLIDSVRIVQGAFDLRDLNLAVSGNKNALSRLAGDPNVIDVEAIAVIESPVTFSSTAATHSGLEVFEVTGYGFDGSTDETDDHVLWVAAATRAAVDEATQGTRSKLFGPLKLNATERTDVDFTLPDDALVLRQRLLSFVLPEAPTARIKP